jgi:hypothetical protein
VELEKNTVHQYLPGGSANFSSKSKSLSPPGELMNAILLLTALTSASLMESRPRTTDFELVVAASSVSMSSRSTTHAAERPGS